MGRSSSRSEGMLSKIIVGVAVTVISTIILAQIGFGEDEGGNSYNSSTPQTQRQNTYTPSRDLATWCCDNWGNRRCQLATPVAPGTSCFCPMQGYGVACK
ncbi:MAG: hypothetical protein AAFY71_07460 [Bacteroidota bacterium]